MLSIPKLLVIILVIAALYYLFFRKPKENGSSTNENKSSKNGSHKKIEEVMVECAKCGTFVSAKEAIIKEGRYFCSKECAA